MKIYEANPQRQSQIITPLLGLPE